MDKKAKLIMAVVAMLCVVLLGVSLWYYFSPSDETENDENTETENDEEKNDSLLSDRPAFTLNVINGDNETTETVTPTGDETVDVTVDGDTATTTTGNVTTTGNNTTTESTVLTCEEGQVESNGECVDVVSETPAPLVCGDGFVNSNGVCTPVKPEYRFVTRENTNVRNAKAIIKNIPHHVSSLQEVQDECMSDPKCNHVVSLNNEKAYFLIEGNGTFYPNESNFTTHTKTSSDGELISAPVDTSPVTTEATTYNYVTKQNTNLHGSVIKTMSTTTNTLENAKSECNKMPTCKYIVKNNAPQHQKYFLLSSKTNTINNATNVTTYEKSTN